MSTEEYRRKRREYMRAYYRSTPERRDKIKARTKAYALAHPEAVKARRQARQPAQNALRRARNAADPSALYLRNLQATGLTTIDYDTMLAAQGGGCWFCGTTAQPARAKFPLRRLVVDHDHLTGRIRGLLCSQCNLTLGRAEAGRPASIDRLRAEEYTGRPLPAAPTWSVNPDRDRAIVLDRVAGLSREAIGDKYGVSVAVVRHALRRAKAAGLIRVDTVRGSHHATYRQVASF